MSLQNVYIDVLDLINYFGSHSRPSGIQRVVIEFIKNSASRSNTIIPCRINERGIFITYQFEHVLELINVILKDGNTQEDIRDQMQFLSSNEGRSTPNLGDVYLVLGAFWIDNRQYDWHYRLRKKGVIVGVFVHDVFPLSHPDLVTKSTKNAYEHSLALVSQQTDFFLCNSNYTQRMLNSTLLREIGYSPFTSVVKFGSDPIRSSKNSMPSPLKDSNFVLAVGTREIRKNHIIAVRAWATLLRSQLPENEIPFLVIVGRPGWKAELIDEFVEDSPAMKRKIIFLEDVDEEQLTILYKNCLFTIFPSLVEGWGLPIIESLIHNKVCIAGNLGAQTEAGGELAIYVDPRNYQELYRKIRDLLDPEYRKNLENKIKQNFLPNTWQSFCEEIWTAIDLFNQSHKNKIIPQGFCASTDKVYSLTKIDISNDICMSWADRGRVFCFDENWNDLEDWGRWSSAESAKLEIPTNAQPGSQLQLLLEIRYPPVVEDMQMKIEVEGSNPYLVTKTELGPEWISLPVIVNHDSKIIVTLSRSAFFRNPHRKLYIGVSKFCLFATNIKEEDVQNVLAA